MKKKTVTILWCPDDMFNYMFKAEFVTLVSFKSPVGSSFLLFFLLHLLNNKADSFVSCINDKNFFIFFVNCCYLLLVAL